MQMSVVWGGDPYTALMPAPKMSSSDVLDSLQSIICLNAPQNLFTSCLIFLHLVSNNLPGCTGAKRGLLGLKWQVMHSQNAIACCPLPKFGSCEMCKKLPHNVLSLSLLKFFPFLPFPTSILAILALIALWREHLEGTSKRKSCQDHTFL